MTDTWNEITRDAQSLGLSEDVRSAAIMSRPTSGCQLGRVVRVDRNSALILRVDDLQKTLSVPVGLDLAVGDWLWMGDDASIEGRVERANEVIRMRGDGRRQVLGANVDRVLLTVDIDRADRPGLIERLATIGWESGSTPHFVVTKSDRATPARQLSVQSAISLYAPGIEVTFVSALGNLGRDSLDAILSQGRTGMLIGHSGVGKSTLLNWLVEESRAQVGDVRARDMKGKHTTTARTLYPLFSVGGAVIDTPGIREIGIASTDSLENVFGDIVELAEECRFSDCRHTRDAGCAVRAAVDSGEIASDRYRRFLGYLKEAGNNRVDATQGRDKAVEYSRLAREFRKVRGY